MRNSLNLQVYGGPYMCFIFYFKALITCALFVGFIYFVTVFASLSFVCFALNVQLFCCDFSFLFIYNLCGFSVATKQQLHLFFRFFAARLNFILFFFWKPCDIFRLSYVLIFTQKIMHFHNIHCKVQIKLNIDPFKITHYTLNRVYQVYHEVCTNQKQTS